jgi:hypothetical protein
MNTITETDENYRSLTDDYKLAINEKQDLNDQV